ncbi:MAG: hypothetical protein AB7W16_23175 [Candidatus Obscuribacterales bacterium]
MKTTLRIVFSILLGLALPLSAQTQEKSGASLAVIDVPGLTYSGSTKIEPSAEKELSAWAIKKLRAYLDKTGKIKARGDIPLEGKAPAAEYFLISGFELVGIPANRLLTYNCRLVKVKSSEIMKAATRARDVSEKFDWPSGEPEAIEKSESGKIMDRLMKDAIPELMERFGK